MGGNGEMGKTGGKWGKDIAKLGGNGKKLGKKWTVSQLIPNPFVVRGQPSAECNAPFVALFVWVHMVHVNTEREPIECM